MRLLLAILSLSAVAMPALAVPARIPEPETLGLLAVAVAAAVMIVRRKK